MPYSECDDIAVMLSKIQTGATPQRPSVWIADLVWKFLGNCWSGVPIKRPSAAQIYDTFSKPRSLLPGKLSLQVRSVGIPLSTLKRQRYTVRLKYGNNDHTTSLASLTTEGGSGGQYTWSGSPHPSPRCVTNPRAGTFRKPG